MIFPKQYILENTQSVFTKISSQYKISIPKDFLIKVEYPNKVEYGHYSIPSFIMLAKYFKKNLKRLRKLYYPS